MLIQLLHQPFDPWQILQAHQHAQSTLSGQIGATAVFIGTMRDINEADTVIQMELEHYPGMTENYLQQLVQQAQSQWALHDVIIIHRVGVIKPAEPIVLVAVWSAHRNDAYAANRFLMEELKSHAPFWKKETLANQHTRWVEKNTPG